MPQQVFNSSGTFTVPDDITEVSVLVVGGGGGGGRAGSAGAGGSGGQVRWETGIAVTPSQNISVTVGAGGAGRTGSSAAGFDGSSSFFGAYEAIGGGGGGGGSSGLPGQGAYGGGGQASSTGSRAGGVGIVAYTGGNGERSPGTYDGNAPGGGGGAGGNGGDGQYVTDISVEGGAGGPGIDMSTYVGTSVGDNGWFSGGGGGGTQRTANIAGTGGAGGQGGGGAGRNDGAIIPGENGIPNTGGGGGGGAGNIVNTATNGGNGGSGIIVVVWGEEAPPESLTVTTNSLTAPTERWIKPVLRALWHDGGAWGAILPTTNGHALVPNITNMTTGEVIDTRQNSRPTVAYHDGWLGVLCGHPSETRFSSFDATNDYSPVVTDAVVPLTSSNLDASPIAMVRSPNGYLWAAVAESGTVKVSRSTDDGTTWGAAQTIITMTGPTGTGIAALAVTGTSVILFVTENDSTSGDERYVRTIAQNAGSYAAGAWASETLPAPPGGVYADDHAAIDTTADGRVIVVAKTSVDSAAQLLYVLVRSTSGVWSQVAVLEAGPDSLGYTRPALALTDTQAFIYYGSFGVPTNLYQRVASLDNLSQWSARTVRRSGSDWSDSAAVPTAANILAANSHTFPVLAHNRSTGAIALDWQSYPLVTAKLATQAFSGFTGDVADGSAIVYDRVKPSDTVVLTTNKGVGGGMYVMGLDGQIRSSWLPGGANSVDYRDFNGNTTWDNRILVATTNRDSNLLRYAWMDRTAKTLTSAGTTSLGWEPYGSCLYVHTDGKVYMFVTQRGSDDTSPRNMYQYELTRSGGTVSATLARTILTSSVVEGLVGDDKRGHLFASEENVGLYRYSGSPAGGSSRIAVDTVGAGNLHDDIEDVALAHLPDRDVLLVSSQGNSTYHLYDVETFEHIQEFTVMRPGGTVQVQDTDGLDILLGYLGPQFPYGLIVVHDGGMNDGQSLISDNLFVDASAIFGEWRTIGVRTRQSGASVPRIGVAVKGKKPVLRAAVRQGGVTVPLGRVP